MKIIKKRNIKEELRQLKQDIGEELYNSLTKEQRLGIIAISGFIEYSGSKTPTELVQEARAGR